VQPRLTGRRAGANRSRRRAPTCTSGGQLAAGSTRRWVNPRWLGGLGVEEAAKGLGEAQARILECHPGSPARGQARMQVGVEGNSKQGRRRRWAEGAARQAVAGFEKATWPARARIEGFQRR